MTRYAEIAIKYKFSPLSSELFFDVLKSLRSPEKRQRLAAIANNIEAEPIEGA